MQVTVLFVCHENICRSPMAEGLFRAALLRRGCSGRFSAESAGTVCRQKGEPPDFRALSAAGAFGVDISAHRARCTRDLRLAAYFRIFAMDHDDYRALLSQLDGVEREALRMLADYLPDAGVTAIEDPYYGSEEDFFAACGMIRDAVENICDELLRIGASAGDSGPAATGRSFRKRFST